MGIGKSLQMIMDSLGTNPSDLSDRTGIHKATIYSIIKRDNTKVDVEILLKICKELGVSTDDVLNYNSERIIITKHEQMLVKAYRSHKELQPAVDKMLDIMSTSATELVPSAARSPTSSGADSVELTTEQINQKRKDISSNYN